MNIYPAFWSCCEARPTHLVKMMDGNAERWHKACKACASYLPAEDVKDFAEAVAINARNSKVRKAIAGEAIWVHVDTLGRVWHITVEGEGESKELYCNYKWECACGDTETLIRIATWEAPTEA